MLRILILTSVLALGACATIPEPLTTGGPFADVTPLQAQSDDYQGERVRWGGMILQARPESSQTCFEVMGLSLDRRAEPNESDSSLGRFIACARGFFEPTLYTNGRYITFTGNIDGIETRKVGDYEYGFPRLAADGVVLWPKRRDVIYVPYPDPFWGPYWPYYRRPFYPPYYYR